ncbi:MAG: DUF4331 domain-containing protein [Mycobacteriales bacterium]
MARPPRTSGRRRAVALAVTAATGLAGTAALLSPTVSTASSHREAPSIAKDPRADNTDVYAFVSADAPDSVNLIANWWPFQEPDGGPNFYRFADDGTQYDINIDSNGDAAPDLTYRWTFTSTYRTQDTFLYNTGPVENFEDPDLNFRQFYDLTEIRGGVSTLLLDNAPVAPSNVGPASMPNYPAIRASTLTDIPNGGGQSFTGQAEDPFFLDLRIFDLLYGGDLSEVGVDTLDGYNVQSIALQVPKAALALNGDAGRNPVVGVWSTTNRPTMRTLSGTDAADFTVSSSAETTQVSRLGNPLVNEVVIPIKDKDKFNASKPVNDGQLLDFLTDPEVPKLIEAIYDIPAPATPRNDLVSVFLTGIDGVNSLAVNKDVAQIAPGEMLRLNMSTPVTQNPNRLGVIGGDSQGFPNGRRLADDVVDIELQVLEGELTGNPNDLGDSVNSNDVDYLDQFPYVAQPHQLAVNRS